MYRTPQQRMTAARLRLLLDFPWFGSLAMRLQLQADPSIETYNVNGTRIAYNPAAVEKHTDAELAGIIAHEVLHCALLHPYRRGHRDPKLWNRACDFAINPDVIRSGLKLPADVLIDPQYDGLSAEVIYSKLKAAEQKPQPQEDEDEQEQEQEQDQPADEAPSTGDVEDAPAEGQGEGEGAAEGDAQATEEDAPEPMSESDWKIAAEQANDVARGAGKLPGGVAEQVKAARKVAADWRTILREFVEHTIPSDYSWMHPNRRHIAQGLYLPGVSKENLGHIAVCVDTSGSISSRQLQVFAAELNAIVNECRAELVTVMYCDTQVQRTQEFSADEEIVLDAIGRGGTCFGPAFEAVSKWEQPPVAMLYFTDLDSYDTPQAPEYPVLWVTDLAITREAPFGEVVRITDEN